MVLWHLRLYQKEVRLTQKRVGENEKSYWGGGESEAFNGRNASVWRKSEGIDKKVVS